MFPKDENVQREASNCFQPHAIEQVPPQLHLQV